MASRYDERMLEIAAQRRAEREGRNEKIYRIEESTETITRGMADPLNWILWILAIVLVGPTAGLSIGLGVIAFLRMTANGKAYVQAIPPTKADLVYPRLGCIRILAAIGSLIITLATIGVFILAISFML